MNLRIERIDDHIILYLNKAYMDINEDEIEDSLSDIFFSIKKNYLSDLNGYYDTKIYIDRYYGIIIDMKKEEIDFFDYYDDQIDMRTTIKKAIFLYQIEDNYWFDLDKVTIYIYGGNIYVQINEAINKKEMMELLEHSIICYQDTEKIIKYGKKYRR